MTVLLLSKTSLTDNYCRFIVAMSIAPLPRLSNVNWLNSHNKHCNSMMIGNYSTLLIGDSIIARLSPYFNIWKRYFKPLYRWGQSGKCFKAM